MGFDTLPYRQHISHQKLSTHNRDQSQTVVGAVLKEIGAFVGSPEIKAQKRWDDERGNGDIPVVNKNHGKKRLIKLYPSCLG